MITEYRPSRLSITQIKAFERNPIYWAYTYLFKLPQPMTDSLEYGKKLHSHIENFLIKGYEAGGFLQSDLEKKAFYSVEKLINRFGYNIVGKEGTEKEFLEFFNTHPPIKGIIDKVVLNYRCNAPLVIDHKSVKNKKYALKVKNLKSDYQLSLYAYHATNKNTNPKGCFVAHNQIFKDEERYQIVFTHISQKRIAHTMKVINSLAYNLYQFAFDVMCYGFYSPQIQTQKKCGSCKYQFGKCPYRDICEGKYTIQEYKYQQYFSENNMNKKEYKTAELSELVKTARDFYSKKEMNKFDLRETIAQSIVDGLIKNGLNGVTTTLLSVQGSDPDYTPIFNKLKENGLKIFAEVA